MSQHDFTGAPGRFKRLSVREIINDVNDIEARISNVTSKISTFTTRKTNLETNRDQLHQDVYDIITAPNGINEAGVPNLPWTEVHLESGTLYINESAP